MRTRNLYKHIIFTLVGLGAPVCASAQSIVGINVDTTACLGDVIPVSVGYGTANGIVVQNGVNTISHPGVTFLPDGVMCDSLCSYTTTITFSDFPMGATIQSVNDINYVRLNIEHSFLADLYFGLTCPNGQKASLMNCRGNNHMVWCPDDTIPSTHVGWDMSEANALDVYLGLPIDNENRSDACNPSAEGNEPGIGWNYCWSDNTSNGYTYAPNGGFIYRACNLIYNDSLLHQSIDSSFVAAGRNFYHPDRGFSNLVGCPLNGDWTITVIDVLNIDNGYIFDWELSLNAALLASSVEIDSASIAGAIRHNDTTFSVTSPAGFTGDTTIEYTVTVYFNNGNTADTTFKVHYFALQHYEIVDTLCHGDTVVFDGQAYTTTGVYDRYYNNADGCDSIITLRYTFMPTYATHDTIYFCNNEQFIYEGVDYGGPADIVATLQTQYGCDSVVGVHLVLVDSLFHPKLLISDDGVTWSDDTVLHGCRPFTLYLRDTTMLERWRQWTFGDGDTLQQTITTRQAGPITHIYDTTGDFSLTLHAISVRGCIDTSIMMQNAVNVRPMPTAAFVWDPITPHRLQPEAQFFNRSEPFDMLTFLWVFDGDSSTEANPFHHWGTPSQLLEGSSVENMSGDHNVTLTAIWTHNIGDSATHVCIDTVSHTVTIADVKLEFPSLVTPNGDGINDRWEIVGMLESGLFTNNELWIYNQWGVLIYHAIDIHRAEEFWDPLSTSSPDGTYYYRFALASHYGSVRRNGTIEVIR